MSNKTGLQIQHLTGAPDDPAASMVRATWPRVLKLYRGAASPKLAAEWRARRRDGVLVLRTVGTDAEPLESIPAMARDDVAWWAPFLGMGGPVVLEVRVNERFHTDPAAFANLALWTDAAVEIIAAAGYWPGVLVTSEGNPPGEDDGAPYFLQPAVLAVLRKWRSDVPRRHPGVRVIWCPHGYSHPPASSADPDHAMRPRAILARLPADARLNYLLGEDGCDGGTGQPGQKPGQGWRAYFDRATDYAAWYADKRAALAADPLCIGSALFLCGADPASRPPWDTFDIRDEVDLRPVLTDDVAGPPITWLEPVPAATPRPTPAPTPAPTKEPPVPVEWCPFAVRDELPAGLYSSTRDGGAKPSMICDHIADGLGDPGPWWLQLLEGPEERRASAHHWVARSGLLKQYGPYSRQMWSNGPTCQPDLSNALVAAIVRAGTNPNALTISVEHEGYPGEPLTPAQIATSRKLHQFLHATFGIPLDRLHVVGHYQFDLCTRKNCPGAAFPWAAILAPEVTMTDPTPAPTPAPVPAPTAALADLQNETYRLAHAMRALKVRWQAAGYPQAAEAIDGAGNAAERVVSMTKGEK